MTAFTPEERIAYAAKILDQWTEELRAASADGNKAKVSVAMELAAGTAAMAEAHCAVARAQIALRGSWDDSAEAAEIAGGG